MVTTYSENNIDAGITVVVYAYRATSPASSTLKSCESNLLWELASYVLCSTNVCKHR